MLTALNIEEHRRAGILGLLSALRRNRIRVEHSYSDSAAVKSVVYELRRGGVSWAAIDRFVKGERGRVLCPQGLELSASDGYRRFVSRDLDIRLCENAALWLLREAGGLRSAVVLIDPEGERAGLCAYLADYTDRLRVITDNTRLYLDEADRLLEERGAAITVARAGASAGDADLVISPEPIRAPLDCPADAVVLSSAPPEAGSAAPVIHEYFFDLPEKYRAIRPPYLDEGYFASALYTLAGAHELGSAVFRRCGDGRVMHTRASLLERFRARTQQRGEMLT